jgi:hypothetical protein
MWTDGLFMPSSEFDGESLGKPLAHALGSFTRTGIEVHVGVVSGDLADLSHGSDPLE